MKKIPSTEVAAIQHPASLGIRLEMALIMERERHLGLDVRDENYGLLIPVRLGDFADPDLPCGSERASNCNLSLKRLAQTLART